MLKVTPNMLTELLQISPRFQLISNVNLTSNLAESRPSQSLIDLLEVARGTLVNTWLLEACLQTSACLISYNNSVRFPLIYWIESEFHLQFTKDMLGELVFRVDRDKSQNGMVITLCNIFSGNFQLGRCKSMYHFSIPSFGVQREK